jgi:surface antigen/cell division protein FtsB
MIKTLMTKQKLQNRVHKLAKLPLRAALLAVVIFFGAAVITTTIARADRYQDQINALAQDNSQKQQAQDQLGAEAASLSDQIAKLQAQIANLQAQINANNAKSVDLHNQITAAEAELAKQKRILGENIKEMYRGGQISTLEMLASSKDLSEFVDRQQYRNVVQEKIKDTLAKITDLRHQLASQKETLDKLIKDQEFMRQQMASQQGEQNRLLGLNQAQQTALNNQIKENSGKIAELRRQQVLENARLFGGNVPKGIPGGGGYPGAWAFAPQDSIIDTWGMYNRECVSFTAWKVWNSGRHMPYWGGIGNANQWDDNAQAAGIPVDGNPRVGDVAIKNAGYYGHAMYVEHVYGDGTIYISQYNAGLDGYYSEARISAAGLVFIHF